MVITTELAADLKTYLETNLNAKVSEVAAAVGVSLKAFEYFQSALAHLIGLVQVSGM